MEVGDPKNLFPGGGDRFCEFEQTSPTVSQNIFQVEIWKWEDCGKSKTLFVGEADIASLGFFGVWFE